MSCEEFRDACTTGVRDEAMLAHLRSCADCLEFGVSHDPDLLFRSIGGVEMEPPGGVDLFAREVMQQIHLRETEKASHPGSGRRPMLWAAAAILVAALAGSLFTLRPGPAESPEMGTAPTLVAAAPPVDPAFVPVVDQYETVNAMIVEMPSEADDEIRVVMIFDDTLPMDL